MNNNNKPSDFEWFRENRMSKSNQKDFVCSCGNECVLFENKEGVYSKHHYRYVDVENKVMDYCGACGRNLEGQQEVLDLLKEQKRIKKRHIAELKELDISINQWEILINKNKVR
jgi:hypothetical protein